MRFFVSFPLIGRLRIGALFRPDDLLQKRTPPKSSGAFVYIAASEPDGHLKIGVSSNPPERLRQLQTGTHARLHFVYVGALRCDGYAIEARAHQMLDRYRVSGEWFSCPIEMAVAAVSAAAHDLHEPIASVDPAIVGNIVQIVAAENWLEAHPHAKGGGVLKWWLLAGAVLWAFFFYLIKSISGQSP